MVIIENIINVLVPLLICGLIFIYFRRKITNLEQSIDIIMKMLQTNELNNNDSNNNLFIPGSQDDDNKNSEINNVNLEENKLTEQNEQSDESDSSSDESNTDDSDSEISETSENLNIQHVEENTDGVTNIKELIHSEMDENKTVLLRKDLSKEELEKNTLNELKKMLKHKDPDINKLSRMNKSTVIENLMQ